jgi:hypothetical protein
VKGEYFSLRALVQAQKEPAAQYAPEPDYFTEPGDFSPFTFHLSPFALVLCFPDK